LQDSQKNIYKKLLGLVGENKACKYLKKHGYKILTRNFSTRFGEIDIIASKDKKIIFIEVKTRKDDAFGCPAEAVTIEKQKKIILVATNYLQKMQKQESECRFDVIEVENGKINHIIDAFCC